MINTFQYCPNDKEELEDMFKPLKLEKATDLVLMPLNDNSDSTKASGGTHWFLLVRHGQDNFYLVDSSMASGVRQATVDAAAKLQTLCGFDFKGEAIIQNIHKLNKLCPYQDNMYDCGMYTILYAETILKQMTVDKVKKMEDIDFSHLTP